MAIPAQYTFHALQVLLQDDFIRVFDLFFQRFAFGFEFHFMLVQFEARGKCGFVVQFVVVEVVFQSFDLLKWEDIRIKNNIKKKRAKKKS